MPDVHLRHEGRSMEQIKRRFETSFEVIRSFASSGIAIGSRAAGVVIGFAMQLFLARILPVSELGTYFTVMSLALVLSVVCTVGYPMLMPKFVAEAAKSIDPTHLNAFLRRTRIDWALASVLIVIAAIALVFSFSPAPGVLQYGLIIGILTAPFLAALRLNGSLANALKRFALGFIPDLLIRPALFSLIVVALWYFAGFKDVVSILLIHLVVTVGLAFWQYMKVRKPVAQVFANSKNENANVLELAGTRKRAAYLLIAMLFISVIGELAILFSSLLLDSGNVAVLAICLKISSICGFGIYAVQQVAARDTADAIVAKDFTALKKLLLRTNLAGLLVALAAILFVFVFGETLLSYFGQDFIVGYTSLLILMLVNLFAAVAGPTLQIISVIGEEKRSGMIFLASMAGMFVFNLILIPTYGLEGAAVAFLLTALIWPVSLGVLIKQKIGLYPALFAERF
ncbi:MAG: polysaccharide biosynthesis C-terminal domain-containing protein [Pseudomonadota bacterium]